MKILAKRPLTLLTAILTSFAVAAQARDFSLPSRKMLASPPYQSAPLTLAQSSYVSFPSIGVQLMQPQGFTESSKFQGFQQESSQSSVMLIKLPGPFSEIANGFTGKNLKSRGMKLVRKKSVKVDGSKALLLQVIQEAYGTEFYKWILATGDESSTQLITATFPSTEVDYLSDELKSVLLNLKFTNSPAPNVGSDVGYQLGESSLLQLTESVGKTLLYTKDGSIPAKSPADPLFITAPALSNVAIIDKEQFALQRLFFTEQVKVSQIVSKDAIAIAGRDGYEIIAEGNDKKTNIPLKIYQTILFSEDSYFLMQGMVGQDITTDYLSEFKSLARSLTFDTSQATTEAN